MAFPSRSCVLAVLALSATVQAQDTCSLCPSGSTLNADKPFYGTDQGSPTDCGGFDALLAAVPADLCEATLTSSGVLSPINLQVYCECSGVDAPGICDMCDGGALVANADEASDLLQGYTCNQFNDLVASILETQQCTEAKAVAALCCEGGAGVNITLPDDDAMMGGGDNSTAMPDMNSTMAPTLDGNSTDGNATGTSTCQICADGSVPTSDTIIPILDASCSSLQMIPIPTEVCDTIKAAIDVGALCGCPGEEAPNNCPLCDGGSVSDSTDPITIDDITLTCEQASFLSNFATDLLCLSSVQSFGDKCCVSAETTSAPSASGTSAPSASSASSEPTPAPNAGGAEDASGAVRSVATVALVATLVTTLMM